MSQSLIIITLSPIDLFASLLTSTFPWRALCHTDPSSEAPDATEIQFCDETRDWYITISPMSERD